MKGFSRLFKYIRPYWPYLVGFTLLTLLGTLFSVLSLTMVIPFLQILFDQVSPPESQPEFAWEMNTLLDILYFKLGSSLGTVTKTGLLATICLGLVCMFLLKNLSNYFALHLIAPLRSGMIHDLRKQAFHHLMDLPLSYFGRQKKGDIMTRVSGDVLEVEWSIMNSVVSLLKDPITVLAFLIAMLVMNYQLTLFTLAMLPVSALIIGKVAKTLKKASFHGQSILSDLNVLTEESLGGIRIIKAFRAEKHQKNKFDALNAQSLTLANKIFRRRSLSSPLSEFIGSIVIAVVMWFGGNIVLDGGLDPKAFITYIAMFSQVISPAKAVATTYYNMQKGVASLNRIEGVLDEPNPIQNPTKPVPFQGFNTSIEFKGVSFAYGQKEVLKHINLSIEKGKTIALVGPSGGGKSTLADLIPRFYDPQKGQVLLDGIDIKTLALEDLRKCIGMVPQQPVLFHDSVAHNIAYADPNPDMDRVIHCAKMAHAHDFIIGLEQAYETSIGDLGNRLSGGQKQRLAIARALYKDPPLLILDEATSALDSESEQLVQQALDKLMENRTSLVIAHRLSTILHADEIVYLENGMIHEQGSHQSLLNMGGKYRQLFDVQFKAGNDTKNG